MEFKNPFPYGSAELSCGQMRFSCLFTHLVANGGSSDGQKRSFETPLVSPRSALVANSLCRGQQKRMMRKP